MKAGGPDGRVSAPACTLVFVSQAQSLEGSRMLVATDEKSESTAEFDRTASVAVPQIVDVVAVEADAVHVGGSGVGPVAGSGFVDVNGGFVGGVTLGGTAHELLGTVQNAQVVVVAVRSFDIATPSVPAAVAVLVVEVGAAKTVLGVVVVSIRLD